MVTDGQQAESDCQHYSEAKVGVNIILLKSGKGLIYPIQTTSSETIAHYPGVIKEKQAPSFVGGGDLRLKFTLGVDDTPFLPQCQVSNQTLELVSKLVGRLTTQWSHGNNFADGSCKSVDVGQTSVGATQACR
jgi:hypothetical protein